MGPHDLRPLRFADLGRVPVRLDDEDDVFLCHGATLRRATRGGRELFLTERDERYSRISTQTSKSSRLGVDDVDLAHLVGVDRRGDASQYLVGHWRVDGDDAERLTASTPARNLHARDVDAGLAELLAVDGDDPWP